MLPDKHRSTSLGNREEFVAKSEKDKKDVKQKKEDKKDKKEDKKR